MNKITDEINAARAERQKEVEENNEVRKKIQEKIEEYRKEEAKYKSAVELHQSKMAVVEKEYKKKLEDKVYSLLKELNAQKEEYERRELNAKELQEQIRGYMDKFDKLKETIHEN